MIIQMYILYHLNNKSGKNEFYQTFFLFCFVKQKINKTNSISKIFHYFPSLSFSHISQSSNGRSNSGGSSGGDSVSTPGNGFTTRSTRPDTNSTSSDSSFTTERTIVSSVLLNFQFFDLSSQRRTVSDTVFTSDTNLLCSFSPVMNVIFSCVCVCFFFLIDNFLEVTLEKKKKKTPVKIYRFVSKKYYSSNFGKKDIVKTL